MPRITLTCAACKGNGFSKSTMPATLHDPIRNVLRGCVVCGGAGSAIRVPKTCNASREIRTFYESAKGYERGAGRVIIEYEYVVGACVHCGGARCEKCHQTGKNVRFVRQFPYTSGWVIGGLGVIKKRQYFVSAAVAALGMVIIAFIVATTTGNLVAEIPTTLIAKKHDIVIPTASLPATGDIQRFRQDAPNTIYAPFQVTANTVVPFHYLVKLEDWQTGAPLLNVFVRRGEEVNIKVPLGTYRVKYAYGATWYGPQLLFGNETSVAQAVMPLAFTQEPNRVRGKVIDLTPRVTGNLQIVTGKF